MFTFQFKKLRFDLSRAVNTPINAISPASGRHLRDKLQRLCMLLSGQFVDVTGKRVSTSDHPQGLNYVKACVAKQIVVSVATRS